MEKFKAKKLWWRDGACRQMAVRAEVRELPWWSPMTWLRWALYRRKNTWSHVAPCLVMGRNPWLNALLVWQLSHQHKEIWVWQQTKIDWWNYGLLKTNIMVEWWRGRWPYASRKTPEAMMEWLLNDAQTRSKVITLDSSGWVAQEMVKDEETAGWVVKIVRGDDEDMESSTLAVSKDRVGMWGKIKSILERVVRDTAEWPTDVNGNQDDQFPCHYLLAGYVFLTSTQLNQCSWLNLSAKTDRDFLVFKGNMWGQRFGNAKRIAQTPESYFNHPIDDSNEVLQMEIK